MSTGLSNITDGFERRIAEIDRQLAETESLRQEREHLARALSEVSAAGGATAGAQPVGGSERGGRGQTQSKRQRAVKSARRVQRRTAKAPEGVNSERIVEYLTANGATSASAIAKATGINRAVVYRTLGKLADEGAVVKQEGAGGTAVFSVPST